MRQIEISGLAHVRRVPGRLRWRRLQLRLPRPLPRQQRRVLAHRRLRADILHRAVLLPARYEDASRIFQFGDRCIQFNFSLGYTGTGVGPFGCAPNPSATGGGTGPVPPQGGSGVVLSPCASGPCQNGATCYPLATSFMCNCAPGYTGI